MDPDPYFLFIQVQPFFALNAIQDGGLSSISLIWLGLAIAVLLFFSGLISGSEVAFFSLSPNDFYHFSQKEDDISKKIVELHGQPRNLLATILICNNLINIAIVVLSDLFVSNVFSERTLAYWGASLQDTLSFFNSQEWVLFLEFVITTLLVTSMLVLFGEITPKIYSNMYNVKIARATAPLLYRLNKIFSPLSKFLVYSGNWLEKRLNKTTVDDINTHKEEIDRAIDLTVMHEDDAERERSILKGIIKFGDVSVKQIMRARVDIVALDYDADFKEVMQIIKQSGYSRMPVYKENLDTIVGILYIKDLIGHYHEGPDFDWRSKIKEQVLYLPEAKKIDEALKSFRAMKMHMGIVVDEYGGTSGLVTLEDIMEEVIGEIKDEFDDELEVYFEKISDNEYVFEGKTMINDMCKILNIDKDNFEEVRGDADSIAGLFLEMYGQLPRRNTEIRYNQFIFKAVSVNKTRIEKIKVTLLR